MFYCCDDIFDLSLSFVYHTINSKIAFAVATTTRSPVTIFPPSLVFNLFIASLNAFLSSRDCPAH